MFNQHGLKYKLKRTLTIDHEWFVLEHFQPWHQIWCFSVNFLSSSTITPNITSKVILYYLMFPVLIILIVLLFVIDK